MLEEQKAEAQQLLDELLSESLIPFKLSVEGVDSIGGDEYVVRFRESRLRSVDISWHQSQQFREAFRTAVLERVARLSGQKNPA